MTDEVDDLHDGDGPRLGRTIMRGNLEKRGPPAPFWGAAQAFLFGRWPASAHAALRLALCRDIGSGDHHRARGDRLDAGAQGLAPVRSSNERPIDRSGRYAGSFRIPSFAVKTNRVIGEFHRSTDSH
jgi:hypothetical protein